MALFCRVMAKQVLATALAVLPAQPYSGKFPDICFKYFPLNGQVNLTEDVCGYRNDNELRQLAASIDTCLLRPLLSKGRKTPTSTFLLA